MPDRVGRCAAASSSRKSSERLLVKEISEISELYPFIHRPGQCREPACGLPVMTDTLWLHFSANISICQELPAWICIVSLR
jgi:hypothetical protein